MRKNLTLLLSLLSIITGFGQNFEGKIFYSNSYKSNNPQMTDQQWTSMLGSTQEYFIKDGNYKSISNGNLLQWLLFISKENKLYTKMANSETALWNDSTIQGDEILNVKENKNAIEILGYKCDEIIFTCKSGIQKYYFNSKLSVDPKLFVGHKFGNWFDYLSKSNALPLKSIIETAQFTIQSVATSVTPMKLSQNLFELPAGMLTSKSPY